MRKPQRIRFWKLQDRSNETPRRKSPYVVRWSVEGKEFSEPFRHKTVADRYRSRLEAAALELETFDMATGLPASWVAPASMTVATWCHRFMEERRTAYAPRTRVGLADSLIPLIERSALTECRIERAELKDWLAGKNPLSARSLGWLERNSPDLDTLNAAAVQTLVGKMKLREDLKKPLAPRTATLRVGHMKQVLTAAVAAGYMSELTWPSQAGALKKSEWSQTPVRRDVIDPKTLRSVVEASTNAKKSSNRYRCLTALVGYAGLRPSEAFVLTVEDCVLPEGPEFGSVRVQAADVRAVSRWMLEGEDEVGLPKTETSTRVVPIPPVLVEEISRWIRIRGISSGPLFDTTSSPKHWPDSLALACRKVGIERLSRYDLRRTYASHLIEAGVSISEVANRMGHSVQVLMDHYIKRVEGAHDRANRQLADFYSAQETEGEEEQ